jgi:hypothetical protein
LSYNAWYTQMQAAEADGLLMLEIFLHEDTVGAFEDELGRCWESSDSEPLPEVWNKIRHEIVQDAIHTMLIPAAITWLRDELKQRADDIVAERCQKELENVSHPFPAFISPKRNSILSTASQRSTLQYFQHASRHVAERDFSQFRTRWQARNHGYLSR